METVKEEFPVNENLEAQLPATRFTRNKYIDFTKYFQHCDEDPDDPFSQLAPELREMMMNGNDDDNDYEPSNFDDEEEVVEEFEECAATEDEESEHEESDDDVLDCSVARTRTAKGLRCSLKGSALEGDHIRIERIRRAFVTYAVDEIGILLDDCSRGFIRTKDKIRTMDALKEFLLVARDLYEEELNDLVNTVNTCSWSVPKICASEVMLDLLENQMVPNKNQNAMVEKIPSDEVDSHYLRNVEENAMDALKDTIFAFKKKRKRKSTLAITNNDPEVCNSESTNQLHSDPTDTTSHTQKASTNEIIIKEEPALLGTVKSGNITIPNEQLRRTSRNVRYTETMLCYMERQKKKRIKEEEKNYLQFENRNKSHEPFTTASLETRKEQFINVETVSFGSKEETSECSNTGLNNFVNKKSNKGVGKVSVRRRWKRKTIFPSGSGNKSFREANVTVKEEAVEIESVRAKVGADLPIFYGTTEEPAKILAVCSKCKTTCGFDKGYCSLKVIKNPKNEKQGISKQKKRCFQPVLKGRAGVGKKITTEQCVKAEPKPIEETQAGLRRSNRSIRFTHAMQSFMNNIKQKQEKFEKNFGTSVSNTCLVSRAERVVGQALKNASNQKISGTDPGSSPFFQRSGNEFIKSR